MALMAVVSYPVLFSVSALHWSFQPFRRVAVPFVAVAEMNASCMARWFTSLRDLRLHAIVALARVAPFAHFCALYSWLNHCDLATTGSTISRKTPIANVVGVHPPRPARLATADATGPASLRGTAFLWQERFVVCQLPRPGFTYLAAATRPARNAGACRPGIVLSTSF